MITYVTGDATEPQGEGDKIIVHCCNDLGRWGSGFVLALSAKWPGPEKQYREAMSGIHTAGLGDVIWAIVGPDLTVANLIGQHGTADLWSHPIRYDAIYAGLIKIVADRGDASLHMPRMGAGLAGGSWKVIEAIIEEACGDVPVTVYDLETA